MQFLKHIFLIFNLVFLSVLLRAEEKKEDPKDQKAALLKKDYSGKQGFEWEKAQAEVIAIKAKLEVQISTINAMMDEKNKLKGQALSDKIDQLKMEHEKLKVLMSDYNKLNSEFLTKYPERGIKDVRLYKRSQSKTQKKSDTEMSVGEKVNLVHQKILKQYSVEKSDSKKQQSVSPAMPNNKARDEIKSDSDKDKGITDQLILKK